MGRRWEVSGDEVGSEAISGKICQILIHLFWAWRGQDGSLKVDELLVVRKYIIFNGAEFDLTIRGLELSERCFHCLYFPMTSKL